MQQPQQRALVLIVDDHNVMRGLLTVFLRGGFPGCQVIEAGTGQRAMEVVAREQPQVVLMDIQLPDANGLELTAQIKAQWPEIRVLIVSQNDSETHVQHAREVGAFGYVVKDRIYSELPALLRSALSFPEGRDTGSTS